MTARSGSPAEATRGNRPAASTEDAADTLQIHCPADGRLVEELRPHSIDEVEVLAADLRAAQPAWEESGFKQRALWLGRLRDWLLDNEDRLNEMIRAESGKSEVDARAELPIAIEVINYYIANGEDWLTAERRRPHTVTMATKRLAVSYSPQQLVGLVTPWNGPIGNPMFDLPPALLAGCAVLTKPSEFTPLSWIEVVRGWREHLGAPPVLAAAVGGGDVGAAVVDAVDMVHFTGSARTGRRIAARCGERLIPCSLELGGKDPLIVLADADLERAANAAVWGGFTNSGQTCAAVERVYAEAPVYDEFLRLVTDRVSRLRQGFDHDEGTFCEVGAMATEAQLKIVESQVDDAVAKGAKAILGGSRAGSKGFFYAPTVLVDVDHSMVCMQEETFGPILPIMRVADAEEAITLANDSSYGLTASLWTEDRIRAERLAERLQVGAVNINNVQMNFFQLGLPQGGWRSSGLGFRLGGAAGIRKYCRTKAVVSERATGKTELHWYPASPRKLAISRRAVRLLGARDWRRRVGIPAKEAKRSP